MNTAIVVINGYEYEATYEIDGTPGLTESAVVLHGITPLGGNALVAIVWAELLGTILSRNHDDIVKQIEDQH